MLIKLIKLKISFKIFYLNLFLNNFLSLINAASYSCGGITFDPNDASNKCTRVPQTAGTQPALKEMRCQKNTQWGCEQYTDANGNRNFYCCPQRCEDAAKTQILIDSTPNMSKRQIKDMYACFNRG
ncbi:unnamed protein product [Meloidogyne enterolobii]|uniref:Uncharacterized protein n=1 Tax=Meloidogyne enterolobii TaxID=390850 RepID=A0ACB1AST9_MELEN